MMSSIGRLFVAFSALLLAIVWIAASAWVALDARARGSSHPRLWAVFALLPGIGLLYYVGWWRRRRDRVLPKSTHERYIEVIAAAGIGGGIIGAIVSPPDVVTQLVLWPILLVCCLPVAYWMTGRVQSSTSDHVS